MAAATALGKINVTSNLKALEKEAIDSFRALEKAESGFEPGLRFGQAMLDLRKSIKHGEWMPTLERLRITYRKAQYWMDMILWQRGERPTSPKKPSVKKKSGKFDWNAAADWLYHLRKRVEQLKRYKPQGAVGFAEELAKLAHDLQHDETKRGKKNELLQRKQPRGGSHIAAAHEGRPHPAGRRR
jgi:hypothetical protein